jgi:hypothetical protein
MKAADSMLNFIQQQNCVFFDKKKIKPKEIQWLEKLGSDSFS